MLANKNNILNRKASYPYSYSLAFLPATSRVSRAAMDSLDSEQTKADELQSTMATIVYEAQDIHQVLTHFVVTLPELKAKLIKLVQYVSYAASLLEPEMKLLGQQHNNDTSASALEATLKEEMPKELLAGLVRDYTIYDDYFSVVRVSAPTLREFTAQVTRTSLSVLIDLPYTVLGSDEIAFLVQVIGSMFKVLLQELDANSEKQATNPQPQAQRAWVRQHPTEWFRNTSEQLSHQIQWWWMGKRSPFELKQWTSNVSFYRWIVGHHLFNLFVIFCSDHLLQASQFVESEQEFAESINLAAEFLRGTTAAMWYAGNFPMHVYESEIRPSMVSTKTPLGFSGTQNADNERLKRSKERLLETLYACYGRDLSSWPDSIYEAFKAFHEIDIEDMEHHVLIAISKSGTDKSLAQKARKIKVMPGKPDRSAADILREMVELKRRKFKFLK